MRPCSRPRARCVRRGATFEGYERVQPPGYKIGKGSGKSDRFGLSFDPNYAEAADFEFASDQPEEAPAGRV